MRKKAFSITEVVVAIAVFAVIMVPVMGLMTMSARKTNNRVGHAFAAELKTRIESELAQSAGVFTAGFLTGGVSFYASRDLSVTGLDGAAHMTDAERYYRIQVLEPYDYAFSVNDASRQFIFSVTWPAFVETSPGVFSPNVNNAANLEQLIMTTVILR